MTQEQKLYACYCRVRSYQYLGRNGVQSGSALPYQTALGFAKTMYTTGKGDCYNFASAFCFLARQLGYDARTVIGKCAYKWNTYAIPHGWVEITIGGTVCLFDAELENYNSRHELSNEIYKAYMTLSGWFRDYVYIPLGGNRKGRLRTVLNKLTVFLLTGLWHGANWTFLLWGLWHGVLVSAETLTPARRLRGRWYGRAGAILAVVLGFVMAVYPKISTKFRLIFSEI